MLRAGVLPGVFASARPNLVRNMVTGVRSKYGKVAGKDDTTETVLYSYFRSSSAWRVRIALALKGIEYQYKPVHLLNAEQKDPEFLRINPAGQVPVLLIDDHKLTQSVAILEYLEETRKEFPLLPSDSFKRAKVRELVEVINAGIQPVTNLGVLNKITSDKQKQVEWLRYWGNQGFQVLETLLKESSGSYCVGDQVTFADLFLVPAAASATRWGLDLSNYPSVSQIYSRLSSLESFKAAHPSAQPDCPEKLRNK